MAQQSKRYPRGTIYGVNGWSGMGELIEQAEHGIYYMYPGSELTIFAPYTSIDRVKYEPIPEEYRDGTSGTNRSIEDNSLQQ